VVLGLVGIGLAGAVYLARRIPASTVERPEFGWGLWIDRHTRPSWAARAGRSSTPFPGSTRR
jgi:hypothetical protein